MNTATIEHPRPETCDHEQQQVSAGLLDLIVERTWLLVRRRAAWIQSLGIGASAREPLTLKTDPDDLVAELQWRIASEAGCKWTVALSRIEQRLAGESGGHLQHLARVFRLTEPDVDLLEICVAAHLDPSLGAAAAHVHGHATHGITDALARQLLGCGREPIWDPSGSLAIWNLVRAGPGEPELLSVDPAVPGWLCGRLALSGKLGGVLRRVAPRQALDGWPVGKLGALFHRNLEGEARVRVILEGPPGAGRSTCAAVAAATLGINCFGICADEIAEEDWPDTFLQAQRLAILGGFGLIWRGENLQQRRWQSRFAVAPIQAVVIEPGRSLQAWEGWTDYRITLPEPSIDERRSLWNLAVPQSHVWGEPEMRFLAERFALTPGEIAAIGGRGITSRDEAVELARETARHRLGDLGGILDCPFNWDDIVLPDPLHEALRDFAFEARERVRFWENPDARRMFPRGTGLTALLNGPSGTGKTMATQVIAAELGLDLVRIDMARVVSKYIGETAKHLGEIFTRAARMSAILLFDEADALFAKRTEVKDAHDRHGNTDTSYLLQLLEEFRGVALLTTNKKGNIDPAFLRRIRYIFEFPKPEARERRRIWANVVRALAGEADEQRLASTLDSFAGGTPVSGAQIKNAVLASVFIARRRLEPLSGTHLLAGLNRELSKEGRSVSGREQARLGSER